MIALRNSGAELDLLPEIGGAVGRFAVDGQDVFRPPVSGVIAPLLTACFPLAPFANRIANGAFDFRGEAVRLSRNFGDDPHTIHGQAWQRPWRVESHKKDIAVLAFDHVAGEWPWNYELRQQFMLAERSLRIVLTIANRSPKPMPASFGFHPYFERTPQTCLRAHVDGVWLADDTGIPTTTAAASHFLDLANGALLAQVPFVDHCHFGWTGNMRIDQPEYDRTLILSASRALGFLHIFIPNRLAFFCTEPVSAMPDSFHRADPSSGLRILACGEKLTASMTIASARDAA